MNNEKLITLLSELRSISQEKEWIEFKVSNSNEIGEYISALSNAACLHGEKFGYLVFGIEDETHRIVGTSFSSEKKVKGNEDLIPWLSRLLNPRVDFRCYDIDIENEKVVIVQIQATLHTPVKFKGTAYIRIGSHKKNLSDYPEKERKIWNNKPVEIFEKQIAIAGLQVDEVLQLLDYNAYFDLTSSPLPSNKQGIISKLEQEKFIIEEEAKYSITNLGAILFANRLHSFENLERKAVRVIIYKGKNKLKTLKEQTGQKGYASGFLGLVNYINNQLPMNEEIGKALRNSVKMYPEIAIRELVANAIIHQDFSQVGTAPMVEIYEDRVEITNPGKPLIDVERFIDHNPQSRNEKLAHYMRRFNICEERGSGIDKVVFECEYYQLPAPKFIAEENYTRIIIYSYKTLRQMNKEEKIRACYLHCCLKQVSEGQMTNKTLRKRFGLEETNRSVTSRIINETVSSGYIKNYDPDSNSQKYAKYIPYWA
jgi:predicted HTH transcriptional regulator